MERNDEIKTITVSVKLMAGNKPDCLENSNYSKPKMEYVLVKATSLCIDIHFAISIYNRLTSTNHERTSIKIGMVGPRKVRRQGSVGK